MALNKPNLLKQSPFRPVKKGWSWRSTSLSSSSLRKNITVAYFGLNSMVLPLAQDALPFAELVRRALIRNRADTSHSEAIVGKTINGEPLAGHLHAHYLPADEDGDGRLDHLTIFAPRGFDQGDLAALGQLSTVQRGHNRPEEVRLILTGLGPADQFQSLSLFRPATRFRSVTPFSLPRFANRGAGKPPRPRDLPEAQLRRELRTRGLPEPIALKRIEAYTPRERPPARWLEFHTTRFNQTEGFGLAGFELEFAQAVPGPLTLGFGAHFGLGLFLPY